MLGEFFHVEVGGVKAEGGVFAMIHQFFFAFLKVEGVVKEVVVGVRGLLLPLV